jgi:hypothetical protein
VERYVVRPREGGAGYGIFDRAVNGWTGPGGHTEAEARQIAERLELLHQRREAAKPRATSREVDPPIRVRARVTLTVDAVLYRWSRSEGGWSGEVELTPDRRYWVKADDLERA